MYSNKSNVYVELESQTVPVSEINEHHQMNRSFLISNYCVLTGCTFALFTLFVLLNIKHDVDTIHTNPILPGRQLFSLKLARLPYDVRLNIMFYSLNDEELMDHYKQRHQWNEAGKKLLIEVIKQRANSHKLSFKSCAQLNHMFQERNSIAHDTDLQRAVFHATQRYLEDEDSIRCEVVPYDKGGEFSIIISSKQGVSEAIHDMVTLGMRISLVNKCGSNIREATSLTLTKSKIKCLTLFTDWNELTALRRLVLTHNEISDITALSGLTSLVSLELGLNKISDITALSGLTSLTHLFLQKNEISNVGALSGLTSLVFLDLDYNRISDISPLSALKLVNLEGLGNTWEKFVLD